MKINKLSHVAIMVKDLEKAGTFFADLLNTEFTGPNEDKESDVRNLMSPLGIELVAPLTPNGPSVKTLERRGEGMVMLALEVTNLEEAIANMESHGIRLIGRANPTIGKTASFHPKDLCGVMIELIER